MHSDSVWCRRLSFFLLLANEYAANIIMNWVSEWVNVWAAMSVPFCEIIQLFARTFYLLKFLNRMVDTWNFYLLLMPWNSVKVNHNIHENFKFASHLVMRERENEISCFSFVKISDIIMDCSILDNVFYHIFVYSIGMGRGACLKFLWDWVIFHQ